MSRTSTDILGVQVDLTDADGYETGRTITVSIEYLLDVDTNYGADADGRRGVTRVEYAVLDKFIEVQDLMTMTSDEVERALLDAESIFQSRQKHFF